MLLTKHRYLLFILLLMQGCIKSYDPVIDSNAENKYVVSGRITDEPGWQEAEVSLTSPIGSPGYLPATGCKVKVLDDKGNEFPMEEYLPGQYRVWMGSEFLAPGTSYHLKVITPDAEELESVPDRMPSGPGLDSVYYSLEDVPTTDPAVSNRVMQFYVDLEADNDDSRFYKWEVVETWEYNAAHALEYYYDGKFHVVDPPDSTNYTCWTTGLAKNVFTVSTKGLTRNSYRQYRLQTIDGHSSRLSILYSILVRQLALSEEAYNYWEQMRVNSNDQGGLYEKQPLAIKGNVLNVSNPDKEVLGFFFAASASSERFFYKKVEGIDLSFQNFCSEEGLGMFGWREFSPWEYPIYYYFNESGFLKILSKECIDCRRLGGATVKPDFWPY